MPHHTRPLWQLAAYMAAVVLIGTAISLLKPQPVLSDSDLTQAINATFPARLHDAGLHELAHQRAIEASVNFSHDGQRSDAEVLGWNQGHVDPVGTVVSQWLASPAHAAILFDPSYVAIGCGSVTTSDGRYFAACLLSQGGVTTEPPQPAQNAPASVPSSAPRPVATPPVLVLPDAATRTP